VYAKNSKAALHKPNDVTFLNTVRAPLFLRPGESSGGPSGGGHAGHHPGPEPGAVLLRAGGQRGGGGRAVRPTGGRIHHCRTVRETPHTYSYCTVHTHTHTEEKNIISFSVTFTSRLWIGWSPVTPHQVAGLCVCVCGGGLSQRKTRSLCRCRDEAVGGSCNWNALHVSDWGGGRQYVSRVFLSQPCNAIGLRLQGLYLYPWKKITKIIERGSKRTCQRRIGNLLWCMRRRARTTQRCDRVGGPLGGGKSRDAHTALLQRGTTTVTSIHFSTGGSVCYNDLFMAHFILLTWQAMLIYWRGKKRRRRKKNALSWQPEVMAGGNRAPKMGRGAVYHLSSIAVIAFPLERQMALWIDPQLPWKSASITPAEQRMWRRAAILSCVCVCVCVITWMHLLRDGLFFVCVSLCLFFPRQDRVWNGRRPPKKRPGAREAVYRRVPTGAPRAVLPALLLRGESSAQKTHIYFIPFVLKPKVKSSQWIGMNVRLQV